MSEAILMKDKLAKDAVLEISYVLSKLIPDFPSDSFINDACLGLEQRELKQRVDHIINVLGRFLPDDFNETARLLLQLKSHWPQKSQQPGWFSFAAWPVIDYVGVYGLEHPELALDVLENLTSLFSAEFAVRPLIDTHFELTHRRMLAWTQHDDEHVRRLASEGCRPRLPWGKQLKTLRLEPAPVIEILEQLKDDPSLYVRKSVANNLNDISKDHPNLVTSLCQTWRSDASNERQWIIKQALRSLIKAGQPSAFEILAYNPQPQLVVLNFQLTPHSISLGQDIEMALSLQSESSEQQTIVLDYKVHHIKANGQSTSKVFKWKTLTLMPFEHYDLIKKHPIKAISTRTYYAGIHLVEIVINGRVFIQNQFELTL
ncbi:MAG: DNA alkylation repair protein [Gammaproteobacteria bacterium]|nr:DNA alkylation repair protein [Gammaproteobacteria bacterium]